MTRFLINFTALSALICAMIIAISLTHHIAWAQPSKVEHIVPKNTRWERLYTKQGLTLFSAKRSTSDLPLLKGQGILKANLYEVMAVVEDAQTHSEWVYRMKRSEIFERPDPFHLRAYIQLDFPWPASDRDSVLQVEVTRLWEPHHEVWITFQRSAHPKFPERPDMVRTPQSRGYTRLRWRSSTETEVMYVIDSDPGGSLPRWLIRWLSKDMPFKVLTGLTKRVRETRGQYEHFLNRWDPRRAPQEGAPPSFKLPE